MLMNLIVLLSWFALPVGAFAILDDWFLRPRRQIAVAPQPVRDPKLATFAYRVLPIFIGAAVLRLLVAERLDFSAVLLLITVITGVIWGLDSLLFRKGRDKAALAAGKDVAVAT